MRKRTVSINATSSAGRCSSIRRRARGAWIFPANGRRRKARPSFRRWCCPRTRARSCCARNEKRGHALRNRVKRRRCLSRFASAALLAAAATGWAQTDAKPALTHANVAYGPHERNVLDFWQAKSDKPAPLAVIIHGGGFTTGSKEQTRAATVRNLLEAGISVAAVNYRLLSHAPLPAAHHDVTRALQFLRSKAKEWNLDKTKVGALGNSAGAQLAMYLAFHDDLADPNSPDPVARESSRLACVAPSGGQVTLDVKWWLKHVPGYAPHRDFLEMFGTKDEREALKQNAEISALALISKDDPPVFMTYEMAPGQPYPADDAVTRSWKIHHVVHGIALKKRCDELGVEAHLNHPGATTAYNSVVPFFKAKLLSGGAR
ncbi:MAG: alpha/beta hydrolase, partial [Verrucomicrobia bacterium]|nr:alpha/beta hydrolase [Verrucomicrobiota bacterium]